MTGHPSKPDHFYAMTDRGPKTDYKGSEGSGKKFPVPDYKDCQTWHKIKGQDIF